MATSGSLFGTYSPQMQEPYNIESTLAGSAAAGDPGANALDSSYWFERQMREGQYADRMADQSQFAKQQLHAQLMDTYLKAMPELAKTQLLPATAGVLQQYVPGLDPSGLQYASDEAARTAAATNFQSYGRGAQGFGTVGIQPSITNLSAATNMPMTQGDPIAVRAAQINAAGRLAAARAGAAGRGAPQFSYQFTPGTLEPTVTIKSGSPLSGYGTSVPPASDGNGGKPPAVPFNPTGAAPAPNQMQRPPPNYTRADPTSMQHAQDAIERGKGTDMYRDLVGGYVGNKPDAYTDGKGNIVVRGKSGALIPLVRQGQK